MEFIAVGCVITLLFRYFYIIKLTSRRSRAAQYAFCPQHLSMSECESDDGSELAIRRITTFTSLTPHALASNIDALGLQTL
jgi:hypothetical protein